MKPLTPRQLQVALLIHEGLTNEEIAARMGLSPRTVRQYSDGAKAALGVAQRRHIPEALRRRGLV